jgi:AcrR family transcriptional regulator
MARRSGRRPGNQDTRSAILAASRDVFAEHGYDGASIRRIAAGAGVDPALVHHYFGTKEQLFLETVQPPVDPAVLLPGILSGDIDTIGERLVTTFLATLENPVSGPALAALLRGAIASKVSGRLVREFFAVRILRRIMHELDTVIDPDEIPLRANLVASQLFGLATIRYVLAFEPLASIPRDVVVAAVAPTLQRYLTGDIDLLRPPVSPAES